MSWMQSLRSRWSAYQIARTMLNSLNQDSEPDNGRTLLDDFIDQCRQIPQPTVLELGTSRSIPTRSTLHNDWVPHAKTYLGTDIESGPDVDIVADVHRLSQFVGKDQIDIIISCSSFEHFKYPHLAAHELMKTLKVGGLLFIQTHQTFHLHSYPFDYFRFSREALAGLFGTKMGFNVLATDYEFPSRIFSQREPNTAVKPAYLNVRLFGTKQQPTPEEYIYEYDTQLK